MASMREFERRMSEAVDEDRNLDSSRSRSWPKYGSVETEKVGVGRWIGGAGAGVGALCPKAKDPKRNLDFLSFMFFGGAATMNLGSTFCGSNFVVSELCFVESVSISPFPIIFTRTTSFCSQIVSPPFSQIVCGEKKREKMFNKKIR